MQCACCKYIHTNFKIDSKLIWDIFTKYLRIAYHYTATSKKTSIGCGNQNGYVDDLPQAPPFLNKKIANLVSLEAQA